MNKNFKEKINKKSKTGFAVLFAVLLATFLISLGISIFSISLKEIQINASIRDSQAAYYAADSARECALYWDIKEGDFPACLDSNCTTPSTSPTPTITCNSIPFTLNFAHQAGSPIYSATSTLDSSAPFFQASSTSSSTPAADIIITKTFSNSNIITTITALGHNTEILGRRVERGIQQTNNASN